MSTFDKPTSEPESGVSPRPSRTSKPPVRVVMMNPVPRASPPGPPLKYESAAKRASAAAAKSSFNQTLLARSVVPPPSTRTTFTKGNQSTGIELKSRGLRSSLEAYGEEKEVDSEFMQRCTKQDWLLAADGVLLTMDEQVLKAITTRDGNLNHLVNTDPNVARAHEKRGAKRQPSVYVRALTHDKTQNFAAFTVDEAKRIAQYARFYSQIRSDQLGLAFKIDRAHNPAWQKDWTRRGDRFFLQTDKKGKSYGKINKKRQNVLAAFAGALFMIVKEAERKGWSTVPVMHYVGYAIDATNRKEQHASGGVNSSWLAQCVVAIAKALNMTTFITSYTVCLISKEAAGPIAEMLLSRLARAYYFAGGFTVGQAVASMASIRADIFTDEEQQTWWEEHVECIKNDPQYPRRLAQEKQRRTLLLEKPIAKDRARKMKDVMAFMNELNDSQRIYEDSAAKLGDSAAQQWMRSFAPKKMEAFDEVQDHTATKLQDMANLGAQVNNGRLDAPRSVSG